MTSSSIFQPREGDKCIWLDETQFYDLSDELEEEDVTLENLQAAYTIIAQALMDGGIPYAAIGGLAFTIMGARPGYMTHDVDFQIQTTPLKLFDKLRTLSNVRLKKGLQADNFRCHVRIAEEKWINVDLLMTNNTISGNTQDLNNIRVLQFTPLLQTKLKSYAARQAERDRTDILYMVEHLGDQIDAKKLDQAQVNLLLQSLEGAQLELAKQCLLVH